jgi:hypothetical protein
VARGTAEEEETSKGAAASRFITGAMAMLGDCVATAEPIVEHTGQTCEVEGAAVKSAQKWNCAARKKPPRINVKMQMERDLDCIWLLRRSLCANGCWVKKSVCLLGYQSATNQDFRPSKMLRLSVDRCLCGTPISGELRCAVRWRCWLSLRCSILRRADRSSTNIRMGPIRLATPAKRCISLRWLPPGWTSTARRKSLAGFLRCRGTPRQAIRSLCIAPAALLPPSSFMPLA